MMKQLRIVHVEAIPLSAYWETIFGGLGKVPPSLLHPAAHFQNVPRLGQFSTIVRITASDGTVGIGEAWGLPHAGISATIINDLYRPILLGRDPHDIDSIWEMLYASAESLGHSRGFMMEAISCVDIALWDLLGKSKGMSVAQLAGGSIREQIGCYASPIRFNDNTEDTIANAREFTDIGFRAVKVKAGRSVAQDAAYIEAIREALGPDIDILVDFNCAYNVQKTIEFAREVERFNIYWLEEPIPPDHADELAEIRRKVNIPISTGENDFSVRSFQQLIAKEAVDVINPNVTRCGGITGLLRIQRIAEEAGVKVAMHGVGGGIMMAASLQMMSTFGNGTVMEYNRFLNPLREELVTPAISFRDGVLDVPGGPGLGCTPDEAALAKYGSR